MVPFPQEWFSPSAPAERAVAAVTEGHCPFAHGKLDGEGLCWPCDARWVLTRGADGSPRVTGLGAEYGWPSQGGTVSALYAYPFSEFRMSLSGRREQARRHWLGLDA